MSVTQLYRHIAAVLAAGAATLALAPAAAAQTGSCTITAQPFNGRSYALAAVVDGGVHHLITRQTGPLEGQTAWTFPAPDGTGHGITQVWWVARHPDRQATADDFRLVLNVTPTCAFAETYPAIPGQQDSVIIRPATTTTTTSSSTSTTTSPPPSTSTTMPAPTTTFQTTPTTPPDTAPTTVSININDPLTPAPTTTTPAVELHTATSVERGALPATGAATWLVALWGAGTGIAGLVLTVGAKACRNRKDLQ